MTTSYYYQPAALRIISRPDGTTAPGARLGSMSKDYTPRMKRLLRVLPLLAAALAAQGCMSSSLVLHVMADGSGRAIITSRVFESGVRAFDDIFAEKPSEPPQLADLLPAMSESEIQHEFGPHVRLGSTRLDKAVDGGTRTTTIDFDDVTQLRLRFPPVFMSISHATGLEGLGDQPVLTFTRKPHENGDQVLRVRLPDQRLPARPPEEQPVTTFATNSREELLFKKAIRGAAVRFFIELEEPLLRTNAPAQKGNRATILDLDLDKMINAMDESKIRSMMSPGSLQEILWQVGSLPGAVLPVDQEVFLEYQLPQAVPPPATAPAAPTQAPPDTEIYLAPLKVVDGAIQIGSAVDITNNAGYDNQPSFTPDGASVLFTSVRPSTTPGMPAAQTDIFRYDVESKSVARVTQTPESEYSPTVMPDGRHISVVRVEADGAQRLWSVIPSGPKIEAAVLLPDTTPVGYHAWADAETLALFVLGQPATLQLADTRTGAVTVLATDIGRSIQRIPPAAMAPSRAPGISFVQRERTAEGVNLVIKALTVPTRAISVLTPAVTGSREADCAWTPDGTLLMVNAGTLYSWRRGQSAWKEVIELERLGLAGVTRLAVSPKGDYLALVGSRRQSR